MNIVITMAGAGSRFKQAGYNIPKFMIKTHGKTLFDWSISSLADFIAIPDNHFIFVARKSDQANNFIKTHASSLGIMHYHIIELDQLTDGQATSALLALPHCNLDEPLIIYNIDTYVEPPYLNHLDIKGDGFIPCFSAPGDHWSFVKLDSHGKATCVREKKRISDNCTIGLYYFKNCKIYEKAYHAYYTDSSHIEKNEKYIAPLYNYLIDQGYNIRISTIPSTKVHVLGTPNEIKLFESEYQP